jgi:hypothetical protein
MQCRQLTLAIAAALAVAGPAHAQTRAAPTPGIPGGAGTPTPGTVNPEATDPSTATPSTVGPPATGERSSASSAASERQRSTRIAAAASVSAGMPVQTASGEPLGTVRDVVPDATGEPRYVLITIPTGGKTAVPYSTVALLTRAGTIVLDRARLQAAPRVADSQLLNPSDTRWQKQADAYWNGHGSMQPAQPDRSNGHASPPDQG